MRTNTTVISLAHRRAAKLAAEIASPSVRLEPLDDETVDEFIERVGSAIADLIGRSDEGRDRDDRCERCSTLTPR